MALPKAARAVGTIEKARKVYLEDYVLQYLAVCREEGTEFDTEIILYGKKETHGEAEIYIIYGICKQDEEDSIEKSGDKGNRGRRNGDEKGKDGKSKNRTTYRRLGYLHPETKEIILDDWAEGEKVEGYYVFYDADEVMKDCLGKFYGRKLGKNKHNSSEEYENKTFPEDKKEKFPQMQAAELVALSNADKRRKRSPFLWIRIIVIFIFIVFCAIAVITVNSYDKLYDFVQTAVRTEEMINIDERD